MVKELRIQAEKRLNISDGYKTKTYIFIKLKSAKISPTFIAYNNLQNWINLQRPDSLSIMKPVN